MSNLESKVIDITEILNANLVIEENFARIRKNIYQHESKLLKPCIWEAKYLLDGVISEGDYESILKDFDREVLYKNPIAFAPSQTMKYVNTLAEPLYGWYVVLPDGSRMAVVESNYFTVCTD